MPTQNLPTPSDRLIYFNETVDNKTTQELIKRIDDINIEDLFLEGFYAPTNPLGLIYRRKDIVIDINTPGGNVENGFKAIKTMIKSQTLVHTIVRGSAKSMGFLMLLAGKNRTYHAISKKDQTTGILYHELSVGVTKEKLDNAVDWVDNAADLQKIINDYVLDRTNIPKKFLQKLNREKKDYHFSLKELEEFGICKVEYVL